MTSKTKKSPLSIELKSNQTSKIIGVALKETGKMESYKIIKAHTRRGIAVIPAKRRYIGILGSKGFLNNLNGMTPEPFGEVSKGLGELSKKSAERIEQLRKQGLVIPSAEEIVSRSRP
jgi:hypothetical protein